MVDYIGLLTAFIVSLYSGYEGQLITLAIYTVGMVFYAIVIWHFYRSLAKKEIFQKKGISSYVLKYLVLFPLVASVWFLIISMFLFFLAKGLSVDQVLLASITIVSSVRAAAYYNEDLSKDLAKMIPFALLGIFIVDPSYFSYELVIQRIDVLPSLMPLILRYLLFVYILEITLRTFHNLLHREPKKK
ncbi:MAG: hypothetical protein KJ906_00120 [Nanoarchaeota archaeon]|nr:hypothetical protein [Nanoarchaeota archaeon]